MNTIYDIVNILRVYIIPLGVTLRCIYCFIQIICNEDERKINIKRIKNALIFLLISQVIFAIKDIIIYYY